MQVGAVTLFCIGLTILSVGYMIVEIFFGDNYPKVLQESLKRNDRYRLDRIIHYMIWGIVANAITIFTLIYSGGGEDIINLMNQFGKLATELVPRNPIVILNIQLVLFSIFRFVITLILPLTIYLIHNLYLYIIRNDDYIIRNVGSFFKREKVKKKK